MTSVGYLQEIGLFDLHAEGRGPMIAAATPAARAAAPPAADAASGGKADKAAKAPEAGASSAAGSTASKAAGAAEGSAAGKAGKAGKAAKGGEAPASAAAAPAGPPPKELSPEELAKLTKEERAAYYAARRAAGIVPAPKAKQMSKAERREAQEAQRKVKEDKKATGAENAEMLEELKLQGLSEEQAREVMAELARTEEEQAGDDDEDEEPEDLLSSVRKWMSEQASKVPDEALHDFNMKVRFQGHVDTTPPDHLGAILRLLVEEACRKCDLTAAKLQPTSVAKTVGPEVVRWQVLLEPMYGKIGDPMDAADVVLRSVQEGVEATGDVPEAGRACGVVGCLMAIREIDMIEDEDLLTGCKRCELRSRVMDKFIEFLEEELEDEDEEEGDDDD